MKIVEGEDKRSVRKIPPVIKPETLTRWNAFAKALGHEDLKSMIEGEIGKGKTAYDIADVLAISRGRVLQLARTLKIPFPRMRKTGHVELTPALEALITKFGLNKLAIMGSKELAETASVNVVTARRYLRILRRMVLGQGPANESSTSPATPVAQLAK